MEERKQSVVGSLTKEQILQLRGKAEDFRNAQKQYTEAVGVLWDAQFEIAVAMGNAQLVEKALGGPIGLWDDCDCNQKNCGGAFQNPMDQVINPSAGIN